MKIHKHFMPALIAVAALSLTACKQETKSKVETKESRTLSDGTRVESETTSDIKVDQDGNRTGTVETKTTVDPEGMMNKETTEESHHEVE